MNTIELNVEEFILENWDKNVPVFFEWMDKINGHYQDSWVMINLKKYITNKHDLDEWYMLFADKYDGNFDYVLKCSMDYVHCKRKIPLSA